jgi:hypothetical protein
MSGAYYQLGPEGWQDYGLPDILDPAYPALAALLERAWFTRVWIIQELAVSQQAVVLCGEYQCSWDDFIEAVDHAYKLVVPARWDDTKRIERVYQIEAARRAVRRRDTDAAGIAPRVSRFQRHVTEGQNLRAVRAC